MPAVSRPTCPTERISAAMSAKLPCPGWPTSASDRAAAIAKDADHSRQAGQVRSAAARYSNTTASSPALAAAAILAVDCHIRLASAGRLAAARPDTPEIGRPEWRKSGG